MKRLIFFLTFLLITVSAFSLDVNSTFGFKKQATSEGYQQYVGKQFKFRYACGSLETWEKTGFRPNEDIIPNTYTITEIIVKDVVLNGEPNKEITIKAVQDGTKRKVKFKGYEKVSVKVGFFLDVKRWPLIGYMPIYFIEPFNEYKAANIGKIIKHPMVKDTYEIVDVYIARGTSEEATATLGLEVKNQRTGELKKVLDKERRTAPFADALEGWYSMALVKVEKPENSSDRYSKKQTIIDTSDSRFLFRDDIISIIIVGSSDQFSFTLMNISPHSLKIIWDEAAFVGLDGSTSKIMHKGVKYTEREGNQSATTVIQGAKIEDIAIPTTNVYYDEGTRIGYSTYESGWKIRSMLPSEYKGNDIGEIRLMLPIQIKDVINEYTFVFKVYYRYYHPELLNQDNS